MSDSQNILALDVGERRIGVAIANPIARIAQPLTTLQNDDQTFNQLKELLSEHEVGTIVVGLPRGLEGQETGQTKYVREFNEKLKLQTSFKTVYQDETITSVMAEEDLKRTKKSYSKEDIDMYAAAHILQDFLDHAPQKETV